MKKLKKNEESRKGLKRITRYLVAIIFIFVFCLFVTAADAAGFSNARAIGMAGSYTSLARGFHSPAFNPANLGFSSMRQNGVELFGVGVAVSNNSFSLDDYNTYTGATLDENDKDILLGKVPAEGLKVSADAEATALAVGMGSFAFSISGFGAAEINMGRAPLELMLKGNSIADTIDLSDMYGEGYVIGAANLSYGMLLYKNLDRQLAVGGTIHYLKGFGYEEVIENSGRVITQTTGFEGSGDVVARTATGGHGMAVDAGASLQLSKNYTVGVTFFNLLNKMNWNKETEEHRYHFEFDTVTITNLNNDSIFVSEDTTVAVSSFSSSLPTTFRVGFAKTTGRLLWAIDWEQGFKQGAGTSSNPRFSAGGEYHLFSFLPLRAGFAIGGKRGTTYAGGMGIDVAVCYLDLAAANYNAISGSSGKGLNFAISGGIRF